jgi:hypothetical protein
VEKLDSMLLDELLDGARRAAHDQPPNSHSTSFANPKSKADTNSITAHTKTSTTEEYVISSVRVGRTTFLSSAMT